ncbi:heme ABC transporter permease CcmC [SAR86 cluster bacterium]|jgi:heme exporter protein C|nr:heme ABC transporter permease CcmC [SAR86 cluster bacterium]
MYKYVAKYLILDKVYNFCRFTSGAAFISGVVLLLPLIYLALFQLPPDFQQGESFRIIFVHVPSAIISELVYLFLAMCGFVYLVWRTKISVILLNAAIVIGLIFTALVLITGSFWGKPTWGTFWVWDARITSTFILFLQYIGLLVLRSSFNSYQTADQIMSIFSVLGAINIPIIKFSVEWWNTLHQGASITTSGTSIDSEYFYLLPMMLFSFLLLAYGIFANNVQSEILKRDRGSKRLREILDE